MWTKLLHANHLANRKIDRRFVLLAFIMFWPWAGWKLAKLAWRFPAITLAASAALAVWIAWGPWALLGLTLTVVVVPLVVGAAVSARFRSALGVTIRSAWRKWAVYLPRWPGLMRRHALVKNADGSSDHARLRDVESTNDLDRLTVAIPAGLSPEDFTKAGEALAHATKAQHCRVRVTQPGEVSVDLRRRDPLRRDIPLPPITDDVDLRAVPLGCQEDGETWTLPILGSHMLCAGESGSGKGSVLWSRLRAAAPQIRAGLVRVTGIDPKGGMELAFGAALFHQFIYGSWDAMAAVLEEKADAMDERADRLRGVTRKHEPTVADPLEWIVVDELLNLTALSPRKIQQRVEDAASRLLTTGRAVGFALDGYTQEVTKDVVSFRNLFPTRVALRLPAANQADMVLGEGSWDQGAHCDRIPMSMPGTAYVRVEHIPEPIRARSGYLDDDTIQTMARDYTPTPTAAPELEETA